ncbi:MAG: sodium/solute symporter [Sedimentisphaerales bacterium]|nr:sodium/solute symporter [Sedimentisphaerales bacterium]
MNRLFNGKVQMGPYDGLVFLGYVLALLIIGGYASYRQRKSQDLFLAGRSMGWFNVGLSIFGTNIGPTFLIATFGAGYTTGMVNANYEWMAWVFLMLLGMAFVPFYMLTGISTMPEFLRRRFGPSCYSFYAIYSLFGTVVLWIGGTLFAGADILVQLLGWDFMTCVWLLAIVAASFTVAGGLMAVMVTDSFQSILMIAGAAMLAILAGLHVKDLDTLRHLVVSDTPAGYTWRLLHPSGPSPWYAFVLGYPVLSLWFWCSDQTIVQRVLGARDLRQGQAGTLFCGFLKILPPFIFLLPGILCAALHPGIEDDKDVFLFMVNTYMPRGLVGLMVAVVVAAVISTLDSGLNSFSTVFTLDIYKRWISPLASERQTKIVGQFVTCAAALMAVGIAYYLNTVQSNLFNLFQSIIGYLAPPISAVFLLGVFWRRATAKAAIVTLLLGSIISVGIGICDIKDIFAKDIDGRVVDIWPHFLLLSFYLFVSLLVLMVLVSLSTGHSQTETALPSLRQAYAQNPGLGRRGLVGWAILGCIMVCLYLFFQLVP